MCKFNYEARCSLIFKNVWEDLGRNRANHDQQRKRSKEYNTICDEIGL